MGREMERKGKQINKETEKVKEDDDDEEENEIKKLFIQKVLV